MHIMLTLQVSHVRASRQSLQLHLQPLMRLLPPPHHFTKDSLLLSSTISSSQTSIVDILKAAMLVYDDNGDL
jgi:hypothetical protein